MAESRSPFVIIESKEGLTFAFDVPPQDFVERMTEDGTVVAQCPNIPLFEEEIALLRALNDYKGDVSMAIEKLIEFAFSAGREYERKQRTS